MIAIVNTGGANLASVSNALDRIGQPWALTCDPATIQAADQVILPGVGAAGHSMQRLRDAGLLDVLRGLTQPTLGICLGMQLLFERSEEDDVECLGVLPGTVRRMHPRPGLRVPHMGWNQVTPTTDDDPLLAELQAPLYAYFVHGYAAPMGDWVRATVAHGEPLPAAVRSGNFYGCQFHPERSGEPGAHILKNFASL